MDKQPYCRNCKHPAHRADCGVDDCGCIKFEPKPPRAERQRTWLVTVSFLEFNKWTTGVPVRVRAQGIGGAAQKAVREAKHARTSSRRIVQTRIVVEPVRAGG